VSAPRPDSGRIPGLGVSILNSNNGGSAAVVALIWIVIAVINVAYARRR
jgi:hypothetical protein